MDFTPQQKYSLLSKMGYNGPQDEDQMENFVASNPGAAAKIGKFQRVLQKRVGMQEGGVVTDPQEEVQKELELQKKIADKQNQVLSRGPKNLKVVERVGNQVNKLQSKSARAEKAATATIDPQSLVTEQEVAKIEEEPDQIIDESAGQVSEDTPQAEVTTVDETATADTPEDIDTSTYEADTSAEEKITEASEDMEAATSEVGDKATVQGQLSELMKDFEDGTPPWASGAMRAATANMQSRGLGASSMAGEAITLAAMQAALPIATADARTVAEREMANLSNEQQMQILKSQSRFQGILSDQSAENAAKQFNASSENQTKQFMADLEANVSQFNATQINAIRQYNAGQENATEQFNTEVQNQRDQFNAQNSLIIAQANAQWRQNIATVNTAEQNEANRQYAANTNALTAADLDNYWQQERDQMAFSFQQAENAKDRKFQTAMAVYQAHLEAYLQEQQEDSGGGFGSIIGSVFGKFAGSAASALGTAMVTSDERLKKDIRKVRTRSDGLCIYKFKYNWGHIEREGFLAQEVQKIYPEAVVADEEGFLSVDYNKVPEEILEDV